MHIRAFVSFARRSGCRCCGAATFAVLGAAQSADPPAIP